MEKVVLKATKRDVIGKQVKAMRREGKLPAVIYGRHLEPISIVLDAHTAGLALSKVSASSLVTIDVEGKEYPALVRERQRDFIKGVLTHVDFLAVDMNEKIRTSVGLAFVGVSGGVKDYNGILVHNLERLEVECLPGDLPERINVDISLLKQIGDIFRVKDLAISEKVRILADEEEPIAVVTITKDEASAQSAAAGTGEATSPELSVERGKKDEE
ncbi:MAG TPA: 50S ribosomal protein L25 [Anaerolineales bacterium]|nr:50S ribosomal protein L25 [Anaerolineales bacterium]